MRLKKVILILIPFLLAIVIIAYTPKRKDEETSFYNIKKQNYNLNSYLEKNHSEIDAEACTGLNGPEN
ncbi:MAG: hypothetical protein WCQ54_02440 [Clostridiaceae bacterium]